MAKRVDNDATQEVSASMLVPDKRPPKAPAYGNNVPKNDASMWMQAPVSADDFVSAPKKRPVAPGGGGRGFIVAGLVALFVAVCGAGVWFAFLRESDTKPAAFDNAGKPTTPATAPAVAATVSDADVAVTAPDAAAAAIDAGATPAGAALRVDAISGADPVAKKPKKRATTKKPATKKKTATAPKKRK